MLNELEVVSPPLPPPPPPFNIRELKQRQRRRQRERHKCAYLVGKNNSFARPARAFFTFVHFFAVVSKTTT